MATGDQSDILSRLKGALPSSWFGPSSPILDAVLSGLAWAGAFAYSLYAYAALQTRISTATDGWLDMISGDFFGTGLLRRAGQSDNSYRTAILANLLRERATRRGMIRALTDLTGTPPLVVEPGRPADTGGYGVAMGYDIVGAYGSLLLPYQAFVTVYRPLGTGIPLVNGYGEPAGGYSTASRAEYASIDDVGGLQDADIYSLIDSVKPVGTIIWTAITNGPPPTSDLLDVDFVLDESELV